MRETGKKFFLIFGFYLPNDRGFDGKFFVQVLKGEKTVNFLYNILQLLHIGEIGGVDFPCSLNRTILLKIIYCHFH